MPAQFSSEPVPRRPLLGIAILCMAGIAGSILFPGLDLPALFLSAVSALMGSLAGNWAARLPRSGPRSVLWSALSLLCLHLAILLAAWLNAALVLRNPSARELGALMARPREGVEIIGIVGGDPELWRTNAVGNETWRFPLRVEMIRRLPSWQKARGIVRVSWRARQDSGPPRYGERWRLAGVLADYARYPSARPVLEWIKNRYTFAADSEAAVCLATGQGMPLMNWCYQARRKAGNYLARGIEHRPEVTGLLKALLLGYRRELPDNLRRDFIATGTYHVFAISGQHIAILALFIVVMLQAWQVCRVRWFFYVAPALIAFTLSTGMSSSAVRGCLMALMVLLAPLLSRKPDLPSALALAAVLILAVDPFQLFDYGFLLSFAVVAGLIVFCPPLLKWAERWFLPDPWRLEPERCSVRFWRNAARLAALLLVASAAAWAVSMPLIARWFNLVSPIALAANLLVVPLITLILLAGYLSILCGMIMPWLGEVFNFANVALVASALYATEKMARIPWGHFFVAAPPLWAVMVWFGTLLAWLPGWGLRRLRLLGPAVLAAALLAGAVQYWRRASADVFYVEKTAVCLVKAPGTACMLVNTGPRFQARNVAQRLRKQGVNRLAALVLPAADERHAGGASEILTVFDVRELWCAATNARSPVFRQALAEARARSIPIKKLAAGDRIAWRGGLTAQYHGNSGEFEIGWNETVLKIGLDRSASGRGAADIVAIERRNRTGMDAAWRIRGLEPDETSAECAGLEGVMEIGLAPGETIRVELK